jgi:hypothetical protein
MSESHFDFTELRGLLDALCEESITPEQMRRLEELVLGHPEAEAFYVQSMSQFADLVGHFRVVPAKLEQSLRGRLGAQPEAERQPAPPAVLSAGPAGAPRRWPRRMLWGSLAAGALAAALLLALTLTPPSNVGPAARFSLPEATDDTVAVLLQAPGAVWQESNQPTRAGAPLRAGWLKLKSGLAQIEFYCGATVILEGPAELQLISRMEAFCARGKLRARVPEHAQGFTIGSPKLTLVDRGTEFGLDVGAGDKAEVHVFQGKVELHEPDAQRRAVAQELTTGQSIRLAGPGVLQPIKQNSSAFWSPEELAKRSMAEANLRQRDWLAASGQLRQDPDLLVYYPFQAEHPWTRAVLDQAGARKQPRDGAIVGCTWTTGRWPGKHALEFKRVSDRVRLHVPGEFESLSLLAWVRVDGLPNRNNSLLMADGWEPGELHWQIGADGTIILGVQTDPKGRGAHYHATAAITPERFGHWVHLAVVYDSQNGQVTHYLDGQPVAQAEVEFDIPLRVGDAEIGNWNIDTHRNQTPIRFLNGSMDEFMMFSRGLSDQEVERLYTRGHLQQER